jgi:glycosyltransferase involved in cell wall biosynthesis
MKWCVVIPTYNNDKTLEKVLNDVFQVTENIVVVNDGSTDNTETILKRFSAIKKVSYPVNRGKGYALQRGFEEAAHHGFQYAVTLDSDGQHYARDIQKFIDQIKAFPGSLIVGSRTLPSDKLRKGSGFANRFSNFWFRFISGVSLPDTQSGFRLYPLEEIKNIRFYCHKYEFELEILIRSAWRGVPIRNIPIGVFYPEKAERVSHFRPFRDFIRISMLNAICFFIAAFYVKPFSFIKYMKRENISEFIKKHVIQTQDSNTRITLSVMLGVFMGIVPIWGYQLITAIALAYLLRLNKFIVIVAANISIPPMIPIILYLSYLTGNLALGQTPQLSMSDHLTFKTLENHLFQYILGSIILAVILSLIAGLIVFLFLKFKRRSLIVSE